MGKTIKVLAETELPPRSDALGTMLVDLCENIHIHCREIRQEFSVAEFFHFVGVLDSMADDVWLWLEAHPDYREREVWKTILKATGGPEVLTKSPEPTESAYWPNRLRVELIAPHDMGDIHVHFRDYRLQITREEFRILANAMATALEELDG